MNLVLNSGDFEQYLVTNIRQINGGVQYRFKFENGYGASVVKNVYSYGYIEDLWELAVLNFRDDDNGKLDYDTPITDDVEGWLTDEDVRNLLQQIKEL